MRPRLLASLALTALLALSGTGPAQASHSWGGYHWARTSNPFTLQLGDNLSSTWKSYLTTTSSSWTTRNVLTTRVVPGSVSPRTCKLTSGRVQVCNASYGNNGWLGVASVSITGGSHISAGSVKLNDTYFSTTKYNTKAWRNMVTCQEVGHTLGLDHQDENFDNANLGTCMDYTNDPTTNQYPNQHDYDELSLIYAHVDSTTTLAPNTVQSNAQVGNHSSSWGRLISGSRAAGHSTYVRRFAGGVKVFTFVTWA